MQIQTLKVKDFSNYCEFLNSYVELKKKNKKWTLGVWKRQLNLKSVSTLTMILKGQRHPGKNLVKNLTQYFAFDEEEKTYFESLVELQKKVKSPSSSMLMLLGSPEVLEPESPETRSPSHLLFRRFTHILREMTQLEKFVPNSSWISQNLLPRIAPETVEKFIERLVQAQLLSEGKDGALKVPPITVTSRPEDPLVLLNFHKEILAGSLAALNQTTETERSFNVTFLNIRREKISEAKQKILEFQNEFSRLFEACPGDSVYQISVQFFPITRTPKQ